MALSRKQAEKVYNIQNLINKDLGRASVPAQRSFRPNQIIFQKLEKFLNISAQNACDKSSFDNDPLVHDVLYNVCRIVVSAWNLKSLFNITTNYGLLGCQMILLRGVIDFAMDDRRSMGWYFRTGELLPEAHSYWVMVRD